MDDSVDNSIMTVLEQLAMGRHSFLSHETLRLFEFRSRSSLVSRYLTNETQFLDLAIRIYTTNAQIRADATTLITLMPNISSFVDPVRVIPSPEQVGSSLVSVHSHTGNCSICQEPISSDGAQIRQCGHVHHRACLVNWFSMSVRCPVCRFDIRQAGPPNQTSSASSRTSSQSAVQ
jgi:hypothetical protein